MASNFYNSRTSRDIQAGQKGAYFDNRETQNASKGDDLNPDNGWDVYADFNNAGPRYSSVKAKNDGYQALPSPSMRPPASVRGQEADTPVELVTVPALGAEWKAEELRAMTKKGRKEDRDYERRQKFKAWWRDEIGLCGKWGTRRTIVWLAFFLICATGIILAFTIPRVPSFTWNTGAPLANSTNEDDEPKFGRFPASFTFNASLDVHLDTGKNFLPLKFKHMHAEVASLDTLKKIGEGDLYGYVLPAKAFTRVLIPVTFNYTAANTSDTTWSTVYNACRNKNQYTGGVRPGINLSVAVSMDIAGLVTKSTTSATLTEAPCPFELSNNNS